MKNKIALVVALFSIIFCIYIFYRVEKKKYVNLYDPIHMTHNWEIFGHDKTGLFYCQDCKVEFRSDIKGRADLYNYFNQQIRTIKNENQFIKEELKKYGQKKKPR